MVFVLTIWEFPGVQVILAWLLTDLLTGIYHYLTDCGWNIPSQVAQFREHHETNTMQGFDWQPMVAGTPVMFYGLWAEQPFLLSLGAFAILAQVPHYYAHKPNPPSLIRFLQRSGAIITPEHHAGHHNGAFDRNFCIFTGWMDYLLNPILSLLLTREPL